MTKHYQIIYKVIVITYLKDFFKFFFCGYNITMLKIYNNTK